MLERAQVVGTPGAGFGPAGEGYFRLSAFNSRANVDEAIELARQRMELSLIEIDRLGLKAKGEVGDSDPNVAIEDAL